MGLLHPPFDEDCFPHDPHFGQCKDLHANTALEESQVERSTSFILRRSSFYTNEEETSYQLYSDCVRPLFVDERSESKGDRDNDLVSSNFDRFLYVSNLFRGRNLYASYMNQGT